MTAMTTHLLTRVTSPIAVEPLSDALGVRLSGFDFEELADDEVFIEDIARLLRNHLLVFLPQQTVEPGTLTRFAARFGPLLDIRRKANKAARHVPGHDMIKVISNIVESDGTPLGDGNSSAQVWHSDSTTWEVPTGYIAFYCRITPQASPKTSFLNMIEVYKDLPEATRERIADLRVVHHVYDRQIEVAIAERGASLPLEERKRGQVHPLVRRHLPTGKPMLYLPTRRDSLVLGLDEEHSRALLDELWDFAGASPHNVSIALRSDDMVFWDNAACVHSREGWPESEGRAMWHVSVEGERPTPLYGVRQVNTIGMTPEQKAAALANAPSISDY